MSHNITMQKIIFDVIIFYFWEIILIIREHNIQNIIFCIVTAHGHLMRTLDEGRLRRPSRNSLWGYFAEIIFCYFIKKIKLYFYIIILMHYFFCFCNKFIHFLDSWNNCIKPYFKSFTNTTSTNLKQRKLLIFQANLIKKNTNARWCSPKGNYEINEWTYSNTTIYVWLTFIVLKIQYYY